MKDGQKIFMRNLDSKGAINICKEEGNIMNVLVEGTRVMQVSKMLKERDIDYGVATTDTTFVVTSPRRMRSPVNSKLRGLGFKPVMDWKDFYPLDIIYKFMDALEAEYPARCTVNVIGKTSEGRDIKMLKISNSDAMNTGAWVDGTIHAREWISTAVVTFLANHIARNFETLPECMTNKDWYFVPVLNPDGYVQTHVGDRMWRKNRSRYDNTVAGVDLNRNFSYGIERSMGEGSSIDPYHINYKGPEPFSEPETSAVKDIILYSGTPFKLFLSYHAYSELIAFPWSHTADPCPDYVCLLEGGTIMAKAIYETTGRMYKVGPFKDLMYPAFGTSIDWSYGTAHVPFSYLVELRSKIYKFTLPKEEIMECCEENLNGIKALAAYADKHKYNLQHVLLSKRGR